MAGFIYPTDIRRITSTMGERWNTYHYGVDFAEKGYHPIYAVADGIVTRSYTSTSYGECITIKHNVGGKTYESLYAHMRSGSRRVSVGQRVKQGQVIGIMGNTGQSTGQHLHFELHQPTWNYAKSNAVNPLPYLKEKGELTMSQYNELKKENKELKALINDLVQEIKELKSTKLDKPNKTGKASKWAENDVNLIQERGISDGSRPLDYTTRQETMVMMNRLFEKVTEK